MMEIPLKHWRSRWLVLPEWDFLHRVGDIKWNGEEMIEGEGVTLCGKPGFLKMPGIFSRMELLRCVECCRLMGIPEGNGCPRNEQLKEPGDEF